MGTAFCAQCGAGLSAGAKFCPSCGSRVLDQVSAVLPSPAEQRVAKTPAPFPAPPQPQPARRGHVGRNLLLGCGGLIVALIVLSAIGAALGGQSGTNPGTNNGSSTGAASPSASTIPSARASSTVAPPACTPSPCGVHNGYVLIINGANRNLTGNGFSKPEAGNHFVAVTLTFVNNSNDTQHPDSFCCKLTDSTGVTRSDSFIAAGINGCESWQGADLAKGARLGPKHLCFEAGGDPNAPLTLVWSPSFGSPDISIRF